MRQEFNRLEVVTDGIGLHEITGAVVRWVADTEIRAGLLTVFLPHTSASLLIQENADPSVRHDLQAFFQRLVVENPSLYLHDDEGPDDMPAHIRAALGATSVSIPVDRGEPLLGTWQGIYVFEHRRSRHRRSVTLHLIGE